LRVLDAGDPVKGATITIAGRSARTGADGRVQITGLRPGRYTAHATAPRYVTASARVTERKR
jgi:protocatechuate 3,4-dioxygenase beta subunit